MPNVSNDTAAVDYVDYFTKQLPKDLAAMAVLRDELAQRQGAMSAVEDANKLKEQAAAALETAKTEAAAMLADAQTALDAAKAAEKALDDREKDLSAQENAFNTDSEKTAKDQAARDQSLQVRELAATERETELDAAAATLSAAQKPLDARVTAFQDKVAALTA